MAGRGGAARQGWALLSNSGPRRKARRYRESSRAVRRSGRLLFPAGVGSAVRRRGGRVSPGYGWGRRPLVRRPAPWRAARRGLRRAPRRASASPPSCWAPRCSRCRCSRAPACRAAPGWRSTWPDSTHCCCCSTGRRATRCGPGWAEGRGGDRGPGGLGAARGHRPPGVEVRVCRERGPREGLPPPAASFSSCEFRWQEGPLPASPGGRGARAPSTRRSGWEVAVGAVQQLRQMHVGWGVSGPTSSFM